MKADGHDNLSLSLSATIAFEQLLDSFCAVKKVNSSD